MSSHHFVKSVLKIGMLSLGMFVNMSCSDEGSEGSSSDLFGVDDGGCANRVQDWSKGPAACLVIRGNRALLVKVPYGSSPGWDFPGGHNKGGEFACQTAARETCEETGYSVRVLSKITNKVFRCEITGSNVCKAPVDEGFLEKRWIARSDIDHTNFRGGTWGDKRGILKGKLSADSSNNSYDDCGCRVGVEGWSSTKGRCSSTSVTDDREAAQCRQGNLSVSVTYDDCGCRVGVEGWSSTKGRCSSTSVTDDREAAQCRQGNLSVTVTYDDCGCRVGVEGWSSTKGRCNSTSETDSREAAQCRAQHGSNVDGLIKEAQSAKGRVVAIFDFDDTLWNHGDGRDYWARDTRKTIDKLRSNGVEIGICTASTAREWQVGELRKLHPYFNDRFFNSPAYQYNTGDKRDNLQAILNFYNVNSNQAVFFDDRSKNIDAGFSVGIYSIKVNGVMGLTESDIKNGLSHF